MADNTRPIKQEVKVEYVEIKVEGEMDIYTDADEYDHKNVFTNGVYSGKCIPGSQFRYTNIPRIGLFHAITVARVSLMIKSY